MNKNHITWNEKENRRASELTLPNQLLADLTRDEWSRLHTATFKFKSRCLYWNRATHPRFVTALDWMLEELRRYYGPFIFIPYVGGNDTGTCPNHIHALIEIPRSQGVAEFSTHLRKLWASKLRKSLKLARQDIQSYVWMSRGIVGNRIGLLDYFSREEECELAPPSCSPFSPTDKMIMGRSLALK